MDDKVVITFGTYDLLHVGHLRLIERAAGLGNKLIVGVSSDKLNHQKKNVAPVYNQSDRMEIVAGLRFVDEVFLEESLELKSKYVKERSADILVMGDDWQGKFDYLSNFVKVIYLPRTERISTSFYKHKIQSSR